MVGYNENEAGDNMTREFVNMPEFERQWKAMGLDDDDLRNLQEQLLQNPNAGAIIKGTGGLRKYRFAFKNKGKSGSGRVLYIDFLAYEMIYLVFAYYKGKQETPTPEQCEILRKLVKEIKDSI